MNATVVYGFLGAGKTTLLRTLVPRLSEFGATALLVNEFGKEGIDQIVLQTADVTVRNVAGGCICCEVRGDLLLALDQIGRTVAPDRLIVEPTGLAAPDMLAQILTAAPSAAVHVDSVVTILDATRFADVRRMFGEFFPQQVRVADIVLVNKADLASSAQIEETRQWAREQNPDAAIVTTVRCGIDPDLVVSAIHANRRGRTRDTHPNAGSPHEPELSTLGLQHVTVPTVEVSDAHLETWLEALADGAFGQVVRAKGFVPRNGATVLVDVVLGHTETRRFGAAPPRVEVIGRDLRACEIGQELIHGSTQHTSATAP